jgi:DNA/RNA-binding domain of Phe-tRNA-synthetase-like protein
MSPHFRHSEHMWQTFPDLTAAAIVADGIGDDADVGRMVNEHLTAAKQRATRLPESDLPAIRAWRRTYAQMGLKPTQFRCAAESLLRRIRTQGDLPRMHPLVDLCNAVSAAHAIPIAVLDLDRIEGDLKVRPATGSETYVTFSGDLEHPIAGEIVYADDAGYAHSRRWVTRQSGRSAVRSSTSRVLIVAEAVHASGETDVRSVLSLLTDEIAAAWGERPSHRELSADHPDMELGADGSDHSQSEPDAPVLPLGFEPRLRRV